MENQVIAGTGHRFLKLPGDAYMRSIEGNLQTCLIEFCIDRLAQQKPSKFIVGGALGFDISAGLAAAQSGIPLVLALPYPDHDARWPIIFRNQLDYLKKHAAEVVIVSKGAYHAHKLTRRNHWMVDRANCVAALWDGRKSGTAETITYAYSRRIPVNNMWRDFVQHSDKYTL